MNTFSQPTSYSSISSDTITITGPEYTSLNTGAVSGGISYPLTGAGFGGTGVSTVTISNGGSSYNSTGTISIGPIGTSTGTYTINGSGAGTGYSWTIPEEFVDSFPDFDTVQKMCKEYPGLKIVYDKFVTTYKLVKDHYNTPEDQRPKP